MKHDRETLRNRLGIRCTTTCGGVAYVLRHGQDGVMGAFETELEVRLSGGTRALVVRVKVMDERHPKIECVFELIEDGLDFVVSAVSVSARQGCELEGVVTPSLLRELPLVQWSRVAHSRTLKWVRGPESVSTNILPDGALDEVKQRRQRAEEVIRYMRPDLDPGSSKGAARTWESLVKLAEVLDEYESEASSGSEEPIERMAERHGVAPATVRSWLFRGRESGVRLAQHHLIRDRRHPLWDHQLKVLRSLDNSYETEHSKLTLTMQYLHARALIMEGEAMQCRREMDRIQPESKEWEKLLTKSSSLSSRAQAMDDEVKLYGQQLSAMREDISRRGLPLPLIPRWMGPLVGETKRSAFLQY